MTAEERLKELKVEEQEAEDTTNQAPSNSSAWLRATYRGSVYIAAEHIDLIADLVVERLRDVFKVSEIEK